ncbi:1-(5-phosphoribosyl)-5-[(5-phosphoribosylamino)methylideneamino]imidazole-4-carboxamide isomerase [Faecalicoccus pleomorphus]|uniref:1-(5-phosphoribosyl)-5-[(5- phosphoribosylamino)methylideneamino]imidazole-4- carboxamide isomerase n=1 Tax=Faecalicoccus pleomorphus TaxID=1323 RepID=UPI00242CDEC0|nr:1-(5-phosphoribosyl)-5-[(5-phosphoribosylamino)methylideneamino]imidazole-4-carboxamide isomerase [Faecalicoccus pleomorphus]
MILLPAIDIIDQAPVRLYQGDYHQKEIVGQSVLEIAKEFEAMKAQYLHMVDLDGAKSGKLENARLICETAQALSIPVEVGGGIRSMDTVDFYLTSGVSRVILGTAALEDPAFLKDALKKYGEKIAVGIDCKDGKVCGSGWLVQSDVDYLDFAKTMEDYGVKTIIFTDISKDGTLAGPNLEMLKKLKDAVSIQIIASGGIRDLSHIQALKDLDLYGAITGKAIYAHTLDLKEALKLCKEG